MDHLIIATLKTTKSNISIPEGKICNWHYSWTNNLITAYSLTNYSSTVMSEPFRLLTATDGLNLGLLIDVLTICVNLEVNTSIAISTELSAKVYKLRNQSRLNRVIDYINLRLTSTQVCNAGMIGEEHPKRIDEGLTVTLSDERLKLMVNLLSFFDKKTRFTHLEMKLLNYWRRGVDLDNLTYWDESYLALYKILEYFENKANIKTSTIPKRFKSKAMQSAYRIAIGAGLKKLNSGQYELLRDFIVLRNNWDIAHTKVNSLPNEREGALYYSYITRAWDYHSHLKEIARLLILKQIGINNLQLVVDGGLYKLDKTSTS